jgi:TPR repeat
VTDEPSKLADELHEAGMKLSDAGDQASAIQEYLRALALDPDRPNTLYNLVGRSGGGWPICGARWMRGCRSHEDRLSFRSSRDSVVWIGEKA